MRKYIVHSVHKISNPCKCTHDHTGSCGHHGCECTAYKPTNLAEIDLDLPGEVMDADTLDILAVKAIARALRAARVLPSGGRLSHVARRGRTLVCFPQSSTWHSHIISLAPSELAASVALRLEAARLGWPTRFATDLTHDATEIATMQPREPFSWCLRDDGTHIGRVSAALGTMRMVSDTFGGECCRFYVWNGKLLQAVPTAEMADKLLAELAEQRFAVRTRRASTLAPLSVATAHAADHLASEWAIRYGEEFITVDTWEGK